MRVTDPIFGCITTHIYCPFIIQFHSNPCLLYTSRAPLRCGLSAIPQIRKRPENRTILGTFSYPTAMYRSAASRADRRARLIKPERRPVQLHFVHLRRAHNVPLQTGDQRHQVRSLEKFETHVQRPTSVRDAETHHTHRSVDLHVDICLLYTSRCV